MYSEPAVGLFSLAGRRGCGQTHCSTVELHPPSVNRVGDRNRTDNRCTPTGSRRGQSHFSKETANEENGSDATFNRCSPNRQLAVRDAGGNRTHLKPGCSRLPGHLAPASSILVRSRT